jgi:hypothetical protein
MASVQPPAYTVATVYTVYTFELSELQRASPNSRDSSRVQKYANHYLTLKSLPLLDYNRTR